MIFIRRAYAKEKDIIMNMFEEMNFSFTSEDTDINIVVEQDESIVGVGSLEICDDTALIKAAYIQPNYRNQGLGDGLIKAMINFVDRRNIKTLYIGNNDYEELFKKIGFKSIENKKDDACAMVLDVEKFFNSHKCR